MSPRSSTRWQNLTFSSSSAAYTGVFSDWFVIQFARRNSGIYEPEHRLWLFALTTITAPVSLILWGVGVSIHSSEPISNSHNRISNNRRLLLVHSYRLPIKSTGSASSPQ